MAIPLPAKAPTPPATDEPATITRADYGKLTDAAGADMESSHAPLLAGMQERDAVQTPPTQPTQTTAQANMQQGEQITQPQTVQMRNLNAPDAATGGGGGGGEAEADTAMDTAGSGTAEEVGEGLDAAGTALEATGIFAWLGALLQLGGTVAEGYGAYSLGKSAYDDITGKGQGTPAQQENLPHAPSSHVGTLALVSNSAMDQPSYAGSW